MVNLFQKKYPGVQVQVEFENPNTYVSTLATRLAAGTAPDIFIYTAQNKAALNAGDYVLDLTGQDSTKVMAAANKDFMSDSGKVYGFSPASWASGPIWNLELLDKVGGSPPATWDEFLEVGHKLKALGVTPYSDAAQLGTILEGLLGSYFKAQGLLAQGTVLGIEADNRIFSGQSTFAAEWLTPLTMYSQLYTEGLVPSSVVSLTGAEFDSELANGQLGALGSGPWDVTSVLQDNPKAALKMLPVPGAQAEQDFWCGAPNQGWAIPLQVEEPRRRRGVRQLAGHAGGAGELRQAERRHHHRRQLGVAGAVDPDGDRRGRAVEQLLLHRHLLADQVLRTARERGHRRGQPDDSGEGDPPQVLAAMDAEVQKLRSSSPVAAHVDARQ